MFAPEETSAILLSLRVAALAVTVSLPFAVLAAHVLARGRFRGKALFDALIHLPLLMPPVLTGYVLLVLLGRQGAIGHWLYAWFGITFAFRWTGAVIAAAVMAFPLFVRAIRLSMEAIPREVHEAASGLGARPWAAFRQVTLPLSLPGIVAGMSLAFAKALGEFGATISFVSNIPGETRTLPIAIYELMSVPGGEAGVQRLTVVAFVVALAATLIAALLGGALWRRRTDD